MNPEEMQKTQEQADRFVETGGVVIYWRPGCPFCQRLESGLGKTGERALWVNIWEDQAAEDYVKSVNEGNAVVPTVRSLKGTFVASAASAPAEVAALIEASGK